MKLGLAMFRLLLVVAWLMVMWVSVKAVSTLGVATAGDYFFGDMANPWRAQFNTDFGFHLLIVAAWMLYTARTWWLGILWAILAINLGGAFTFAYLLVMSFLVEGDVQRLLLGRQAR